jgi:hypothetical protein
MVYFNMPSHFTSKRKPLVPAQSLTQDRPTYSLVTMFTELPQFKYALYYMGNLPCNRKFRILTIVMKIIIVIIINPLPASVENMVNS